MALDENKLRKYMWCSIGAALHAQRQTNRSVQRPYVGAVVISSQGDLVSEGYRKFINDTSFLEHAERVALDQAGERAQGGILFTTLEPCSRIRDSQILMPCSQLIVERGIDTVIVGLLDNSTRFRPGKGLQYLRDYGVTVIRYQDLNAVIQDKLMQRSYRNPEG